MIGNGNGVSHNHIPIKYGVVLGVHEIPITMIQSEFLMAVPTMNDGVQNFDDLVTHSDILSSAQAQFLIANT